MILDQGYEFGLGIFETIALERGEPVFLSRHLQRMRKSAKFLGLEEQNITEESIGAWLEAIDEKEKQHSALKLMMSEKNLLFQIRPNPYTEERYQNGFVMDFSEVRRNETSPLIYHKTMNYGDCILEKRAAANCGMDERIFLNTRGQIAEGTVSNIFFVKNGKLETPACACGLLPGILRSYLCEKEQVRECEIYPEELEQYEECFVTNSLMGMMPVRKLGERMFPQSVLAQKLRRQYLQEIKKVGICKKKRKE